PLAQLHLTLGLSYDKVTNDLFDQATALATSEDEAQFNPKFGLLWTPTQQTTVRVAAFRTLRRLTHANQTIEPTQIAGFNQFFDDFIGTKAKRYGIGLDHQFSASQFAGIEFSRRDSDKQVIDPGLGTTTQVANNEALHRAYFYQILNPRWNVAIEYFYGHASRDFSEGVADSTDPVKLTTHYLPLSLNYHQPRGFFSKTALNLVSQRVAFATEQELARNKATFTTMDITLGYRLPSRKTILSITAQNIFDNQFNFHDTSLSTETPTPLLARFRPERSVFATVAFWF
ncbi:MAG: TonB-dependent receptor, partial [Pseudomonadota bacterium]